jgi:hypothetical protein
MKYSDVKAVGIDSYLGGKFYLLSSCVFLLLIASTIKPFSEVFEGLERSFSPFMSLFMMANNAIVICSFLLFGIYLLHFEILRSKISSLPVLVWIFIGYRFLCFLINYAHGVDGIGVDLIAIILIFIYAKSYGVLVSPDNNSRFLNLIVFYSMFFVIMNFSELLLNFQGAVWAGRMFGITNHPNFLGGYAGLLALYVLCAALVGIKKHLSILLFLLLIFLVLASASRSSLASLVIGCCVFAMIYTKKIFAIPFILLLIISPFLLVDIGGRSGVDGGLNFARLLSSQNTREDVVYYLIEAIMSAPFFGDPFASGYTSNSYLTSLARYGFVGTFPLFLLLFICLVVCIRLAIQSEKGNVLLSLYVSQFAFFIIYLGFEGVIVENFSFALLQFIPVIFYLSSAVKFK